MREGVWIWKGDVQAGGLHHSASHREPPPQLQLHSLTVLYSTLTHLCRHLHQVTAAVAISGSGHRIQCRHTARAVAWPRRKHGLGGGYGG